METNKQTNKPFISKILLSTKQNLSTFIKTNKDLRKFISFFIFSSKARKEFRGVGNKKILITNQREKKLKNNKNINCYVIGNNNTIIIETPINITKLKISINGDNNKIHIKKSFHYIKNTEILVNSNNSKIFIDENILFQKTNIYQLEDNCELTIGKNCMCAADVDFFCSDSHAILDITSDEIINYPKPIHIMDNVWLCTKVNILKGATIPSNTIVGLGSTVTKKFTENNSIIAGNPAKIIKKNIKWKREPISVLLKNQ